MDQKFQEGLALWNLGKAQEAADLWMDLAEHGHLGSIEKTFDIFLGQKEFEVAESFLNYAIDQNDPLIMYLRARMVEESVGFEKALPIFKSAIAFGSDQACLQLIDHAIEKDDLIEAQVYLDDLVEFAQNSTNPSPSVLYLIGIKEREILHLKSKRSSEVLKQSGTKKIESDRSLVDLIEEAFQNIDDDDDDDDTPDLSFLYVLSSPQLTKAQAVEFLDKHKPCFEWEDSKICEVCEVLDVKVDVLRVLASNPALDQTVQMRVLDEALKWQERELGVMKDFAGNPNISDEVKEYIFGEAAEFNNYVGTEGIIEEIAELAEGNPRISKEEIEKFLSIYSEENW
jgi:tetratricopeptide (TPR) repeat protein